MVAVDAPDRLEIVVYGGAAGVNTALAFVDGLEGLLLAGEGIEDHHLFHWFCLLK